MARYPRPRDECGGAVARVRADVGGARVRLGSRAAAVALCPVGRAPPRGGPGPPAARGLPGVRLRGGSSRARVRLLRPGWVLVPATGGDGEPDLPGPDDEWPEATAGEPTRCLFAFFAGWDLSEIEGHAFGPADTAEESAVWLVERQEGSPYSYGLVDGAGTWLIPLGKRFRSVRPFRDGVAEVVLNDRTTSYAGPWSRIRTDGSLVG